MYDTLIYVFTLYTVSDEKVKNYYSIKKLHTSQYNTIDSC